MDKLLYKIQTYIIFATIAITPFAVATISPNPFTPIKLTILAYGVGLAILVWAIRIIVNGKLELSVGNFDFPVLLVAVAYLLSTFLRTPNKMEAILLPGTTTIVVASAFLYFLVNQLTQKDRDAVKMLIAGSASIFSLLMLLATGGVFDQIPQLPALFKASNFTPSGGYVPAFIFLLAVLPIAIALVVAEKKPQLKLGFTAVSALIIIGLGISVYNILPGRPNTPRFPSINTSWFVSVDALKNSPLMGVGPGNYLTAFNRFRPIDVNNTDLWAIKFSTATNYYFTALTETGLIGAAGIILLVLSVYKVIRKDIKEKRLVGWGFAGSAPLISLALLLILLAVYPAAVNPMLILFVLLSLNATTRKTKLNLTTEAEPEGPLAARAVGSRFPALLVSLPLVIIVGYVGFRGVQIVRAEYRFRQALNALVNNQAIPAYDTMREAISINPLVDRYHANYAQVNLALANSLATGTDAEGNPREITDQDRANIAQLVQQAIREAKATVALNPLRAGNWLLLGNVYRAIIPLAQGADVFAAQTYSQAIALDPYNPNLRIQLGGLHYAAGNYDTATRILELAVSTKPDLANARYNLAFALKEDGQLDAAVQQMTLVLSLVDRDSQDYELASQALEQLQSEQAEVAGQQAQGQNLTPPQPAEEPVLEPPLDLPEESEPPESPITPTPTPEEVQEGDSQEATPTPLP